jgi:hypothetical protein
VEASPTRKSIIALPLVTAAGMSRLGASHLNPPLIACPLVRVLGACSRERRFMIHHRRIMILVVMIGCEGDYDYTGGEGLYMAS